MNFEIPIDVAARTIRLRMRLSQRKLAKLTNISHVHVNSIENGKVSPTVTTMNKYFDHFGVDLYMLAVALGDSNRMTDREKLAYMNRFGRTIDRQVKNVSRT